MSLKMLTKGWKSVVTNKMKSKQIVSFITNVKYAPFKRPLTLLINTRKKYFFIILNIFLAIISVLKIQANFCLLIEERESKTNEFMHFC